MSNLYYTGTQNNIDIANAQISSNLGLPFRGTQIWAILQSSYSNADLWFFLMPLENGWTREDGTHFSQSEMVQGVVNVTIQESQSNWWPPYPPEGVK